MSVVSKRNCKTFKEGICQACRGYRVIRGVVPCFQQPHQPTNKNTNGLLREYLPKGKDITDIPDGCIQEKVIVRNLCSSKCLDYKTSYEVHFLRRST